MMDAIRNLSARIQEDPNLRQSLLAFGAQALQPRTGGQTQAGQFGQAALAGSGLYRQLSRQDLEDENLQARTEGTKAGTEGTRASTEQTRQRTRITEEDRPHQLFLQEWEKINAKTAAEGKELANAGMRATLEEAEFKAGNREQDRANELEDRELRRNLMTAQIEQAKANGRPPERAVQEILAARILENHPEKDTNPTRAQQESYLQAYQALQTFKQAPTDSERQMAALRAMEGAEFMDDATLKTIQEMITAYDDAAGNERGALQNAMQGQNQLPSGAVEASQQESAVLGQGIPNAVEGKQYKLANGKIAMLRNGKWYHWN